MYIQCYTFTLCIMLNALYCTCVTHYHYRQGKCHNIVAHCVSFIEHNIKLNFFDMTPAQFSYSTYQVYMCTVCIHKFKKCNTAVLCLFPFLCARVIVVLCISAVILRCSDNATMLMFG